MLDWLRNILFITVWMSSCSHYHSFMSVLFSAVEITPPHKTMYRIKYSLNKGKPTISKAGNPPNGRLKVQSEYFHRYLFTEYPNNEKQPLKPEVSKLSRLADLREGEQLQNWSMCACTRARGHTHWCGTSTPVRACSTRWCHAHVQMDTPHGS